MASSQPCDFRTGRERCGITPTTEVDGRGPLCETHAQFVAGEREDRAERAAKRSALLEQLAKLNHPRGGDSKR